MEAVAMVIKGGAHKITEEVELVSLGDLLGG